MSACQLPDFQKAKLIIGSLIIKLERQSDLHAKLQGFHGTLMVFTRFLQNLYGFHETFIYKFFCQEIK